MRYTPQPFYNPIIRTIATELGRDGAQGWITGEYLRNCLLGRPAHNVTIVVADDGTDSAPRLAEALGGTFVPAHAAGIIGRITTSVPDDTPLYVELDSMQGKTIEEYLRREAFTVNALAVELGSRRLIDVSDGYADINRGRLRTVSRRAFHDDPVQLIRAIRTAASLQFTIAPETEALIRKRAHTLADAPPNRIRKEFMRLLALEPAAQHISTLDDLGLLQYVLPELVACQNVMQPKEHTLDVYGHTLQALTALEDLWPWRTGTAGERWHAFWQGRLNRHRGALTTYLRDTVPGHHYPRWLLLKLAAVLHDVGKPAARSVDVDGEIHFYDHDHVGAEIARRRLRALGFSFTSMSWVTEIIRHHSRPLRLSMTDDSGKAAEQFVRDIESSAMAVAVHSAADQLGKGQSAVPQSLRETFTHIWTAGFQDVARPRLVIDTSCTVRSTGAVRRNSVPPVTAGTA